MNYFKTCSLFGVAIAAVASSCAFAEAESKIDEMIIVSSRIEQPLREVGTSVSFVTSEGIDASGVTTFGDVLRTLPGVSVSNTGGVGKVTSVRIRGEEGYRSLVLIDGLDVTDVSAPQAIPSVEHISLRGIGRIEVLRGPQGMMYGADAGGVVNISTRTFGDDWGFNISNEIGRYDSHQLNAEIGGGLGIADFYFSGAQSQTDGFNSRSDDTVVADTDGYDNTTYHARFGLQLSDVWRIDGVARNVHALNQYDNCFVISQDCENDFDLRGHLIKASATFDDYTNEVSALQNDSTRAYSTDGQYQFMYESRLEKFSYLGSAHFADELGFVYGLERKQEAFEGTYNDLAEQNQKGYFVEYQGKFAQQLFVTAGGRYDDNDQYGTHSTFRFSGAWLVEVANTEVKFKSSWSSGFRAPSLSEMQFNSLPWASLAAKQTVLKEEDSRGFDVGTEMFFDGGAVVELVYFNQRLDDQIYYNSGYLQEDGRSRAKGVEVYTSVPFGELFTLGSNYTYTDAKAVDGSERVLRPRHVVNLSLDMRLLNNRLKLGINPRYSGVQTDADGSTEIDQYTVTNLSVRYAPVKLIEIFARLENVFDKDYIEVKNYNTSGRAGYMGINLQF